MKKLLATVALAATLISGVAQADDNSTIMGPGAISCTKFISLSNQRGSDGKMAEIGFYFWAQGFLTAVNLAKAANDQPMKSLSSIDTDDQRTILRDYCKGHPTKNFMDGVIELETQFDDSSD